MALGFGPRSTPADFVPYLRYNAMGVRGGIWSDRDHDDIAFVALNDLEHIGWRPRPHELAPSPPAAKNAPQPRPRPPALALGRDSLDDIILF